ISAASGRGSPWDALPKGCALLGQALPAYWVGLILIIVLSVQLNLLPVAGRSGWRSLVMPMITLGMGTLGRLTQLTRSVMLDALAQDYVRTAWAKGLAPSAVRFRHALKNAAIP